MSGSQNRGTDSVEHRSVVSEFTGLFTSVRTTVTLLFILAAASVIGTVIPQDPSVEQVRQTAFSFSGRLAAILDLHGVYRSWWFVLLLALLAVNLLACLIKRIPAIRDEWNDAAHKTTFSFTVSTSKQQREAKEILRAALKPVMGSPEVADGKVGPGLVWVKHRAHLLGFPCIHVGIVVILAGGLIGLLYGIQGNIQIKEGQTGNEYAVLTSGEVRSLPFTVAVDKFVLDRYPTGEPKEYRSDVRILKDGREVLKGAIRVNHPLTVDGFSLYQSDYKVAGISDVRFRVTDSQGTVTELSARPRTETPLPGSDLKIRLLTLDSARSERGPWVEIAVEGPGREPKELRLFHNDREPVDAGGVKLQFLGYHLLYATGLQIGYDPGARLVWSGSGFLIVGFLLTLFTNHRGVRVEVTGKGRATQVRVSGRSRRMRREFREKLEARVREALKS